MSSKKEKAMALRRKGYSYGQIMKKLNVTSKGTISYWFRDIKLSSDSKRRLEKNKKLSIERGLDNFNKKRSTRIKKENKSCFDSGLSEVSIQNTRELLILGAALYWGEGTKYEDSCPSLIFTNSDPDMVRSYMVFLRQGLKIEEEKIKAGIHLHPYVDEIESRVFWSDVTGLKKDLFYIVSAISSASASKRRRRKLPYGMVVIKVNNRKVFFRVKGMIEGLKKHDF